jgi:hypothetical protein
MREIPTNNGIIYEEYCYKDMKSRFGINYTHETIYKELGTQYIITLKK